MKRIPELDGLRGVAIALVIVWHYFAAPLEATPGSALAYLQAAGRLTWSGVDLFFVLSGFLIGGILLDSRESAEYFRCFYTRRFFRIVPIYAVVLCAAFAYIARSAIQEAPGLQVQPWYTYPLFIQNFWMAAANSLGFLGITWSLAIEEQFYLTLPSIIRFAKRGLPYIVATGIALAPFLRVLIFSTSRGNWVAPYVVTPCRADALLLGVAAAMLIRNESCHGWLTDNQYALQGMMIILAAGAAAFTLHPRWIRGMQMNSVGYTGLALLYVMVLLLAVTQPKSWLGAVLRFKPLRGLGSIAYAVYLLHELFFAALKYSFPQLPLATIASIGLGATFTLAALSWRYFEKPLIDFSHRVT
jgi:peptidoglycan/LPS O-acetylase OafA/YrhL